VHGIDALKRHGVIGDVLSIDFVPTSGVNVDFPYSKKVPH